MADIADIKKWCEEARKILGRTGQDGRGTMQERSDEVAKLLGKLEGIPELAADYQRFKTSYERIAVAAREAAKGGDKAKVIQASRDLSLLKNELRIKLAEAPGAGKDSRKDKEKAEKRLGSSEKQGWGTSDEQAEREKDRLQVLADAIRNDALMSQVPADATPEEVLAAGLADARAEVIQALKERDTRSEDDVKAARGLLAKVRLAIQAAEAEATKRLQKQAYESAYALIKADFDKALETYFLKAAKLAVPCKAFEVAWGPWNTAVGAQDWVKARAALPDLKAASLALKNAGAAALGEKPAFDLAYKAITGLRTAQAVQKAAPKPLVAVEIKAFHEAYMKVNDARSSGDYARAKDGIAALQEAINKLGAADRKLKREEQAFKQEQAKITDLAAAQALAAANSPAVAAKVAAFNLANDKVQAQVTELKWAEAKPLLADLKLAAEALLAARNSYNTGFTDESKRLFQEKLNALKSRTDVAAASGPTPHVEGLKAKVTQLLGRITTAVSGGDHASAEMLLPQLTAPLAAMESAITEYEQHLLKFNAAKNGAVKTAREFLLTPPKLAGERDKALAATEARIKHFADKGSIAGKANPMVEDWIKEADAWKAAQAASDNLNTGSDPDSGVLRTLANLPGGGKVLDALMDGLPEGKPEKFLKDAINIRFGIDVKRFEKKNPTDVTKLQGLTAIPPQTPDKSLKKMYQLFCQVPLSNVKGKVSELIQFDEDAGGAAALGSQGKIWMYCGKPDGTAKQKFGRKGGVVPEGETIDEDFRPTSEDELPYFDFAALHEVGHVVDAKQGIMSDPTYKDIAGWQKHSSDEVAAVAAAHFKYNLQYVKDMLKDKSSTPPTVIPAPEGGVSQSDWDKAREAVVSWCQSVREGMSPWDNAALSKHVAIAGRVYQEAYGNDWVSYLVSARSKGITSYQFRSPAEWFAELYAAYFTGKLKKNHPYASWLKPLKKVA